MTQAPLAKIRAATAAEVCANFSLDVEAKKLLRDGMNPQEFLTALIEKKKHVAAIDFMAHALPAREGVWWGCLCMQHALGDTLPPAERAAATAAVQWVMRPTEENRTVAKAPAESADPLSPAGALAMAVNQTGGSVAPPSSPSMAPPPFATAQAIARAVKLASLRTEPASLAKTQRGYVDLAMRVAEGRLG
jgi:hypothetical protein